MASSGASDASVWWKATRPAVETEPHLDYCLWVHARPGHGVDAYNEDGLAGAAVYGLKREPAMLPTPRRGPDQLRPVMPGLQWPGGRVGANLTAPSLPAARLLSRLLLRIMRGAGQLCRRSLASARFRREERVGRRGLPG
jgi:hypothetical protein